MGTERSNMKTTDQTQGRTQDSTHKCRARSEEGGDHLTFEGEFVRGFNASPSAIVPTPKVIRPRSGSRSAQFPRTVRFKRTPHPTSWF